MRDHGGLILRNVQGNLSYLDFQSAMSVTYDCLVGTLGSEFIAMVVGPKTDTRVSSILSVSPRRVSESTLNWSCA